VKRFDPHSTSNHYIRHGDSVYAPFDPELNIAGEKIRFIVNAAADSNSLQYDQLGRLISVDLREDKIRNEIQRRLLSDVEKVENSGVNGLCKLFLYEHFIVSRLSWFFLVHDLSLTFARELDDKVIPRLKKWAGLYRSADLGALFRNRDHLGLQLTSISYHYKHMQVVRSCLLSTSKDPLIQQIFHRKTERVSAFTRRWSGPKMLTVLAPIVNHSIRFAGQTDRAGLGARNLRYLSQPKPSEIRLKTGEILDQLEEENYLQHASCLARQGIWTQFEDVRPFDLSWKNLIYGPGPKVIAFVLNAQINSVKTPDMLKLWGLIPTATCPLCSHSQCTLHHILVNCPFAREQKRYNWRHDSVLANIEPRLSKLISVVNERKKLPSESETTRCSCWAQT